MQSQFWVADHCKIWLPVHHNIFSHSLTCERFAECEEHVEYSGIVHNVDSSHPNWKRSGQELGETLELIDAKVPTIWILLIQCMSLPCRSLLEMFEAEAGNVGHEGDARHLGSLLQGDQLEQGEGSREELEAGHGAGDPLAQPGHVT